MPTSRAHIALGSNLGERADHLQLAVDKLCSFVRVDSVSAVYNCRSHVMPGSPVQPDYLNAVLACTTRLGPEQLLTALLDIETQAGRRRSDGIRWQARTIDLDLICYDDLSLNTERLTLPHPRLAERLFVLKPLSEIDIDLHIPPPFDQTVRYLLGKCPDKGAVVQTNHVLKYTSDE